MFKGTSRTPPASNSCNICCTASSSICILTRPLSHAFDIPESTLRLSNGSLLPSRFSTRNSARSISSYVVNRKPHFTHSRRLRMLRPSLDARESTTLSSMLPHLEQYMLCHHGNYE